MVSRVCFGGDCSIAHPQRGAHPNLQQLCSGVSVEAGSAHRSATTQQHISTDAAGNLLWGTSCPWVCCATTLTPQLILWSSMQLPAETTTAVVVARVGTCGPTFQAVCAAEIPDQMCCSSLAHPTVLVTAGKTSSCWWFCLLATRTVGWPQTCSKLGFCVNSNRGCCAGSRHVFPQQAAARAVITDGAHPA